MSVVEAAATAMKWVDVTSYSQGDKCRVPQTFSAEAGSLELIVTRWVRGDPTKWYLTCDGIVGNWHELQSVEVEDAKAEAVAIVKSKLKEWLAAMEVDTEFKVGDLVSFEWGETVKGRITELHPNEASACGPWAKVEVGTDKVLYCVYLRHMTKS